jgi:hypothetical protein
VTRSGGLGDALFIGGYDLSNDAMSVQNIRGGPAALVKTGIDKLAFERVGGMRDGGFEVTNAFNPASDRAHDRYSLLPTADVVATYCRGTTLGNQAAEVVAKQVGYDGTRGGDGDLNFNVAVQANGFGLEWCTQLTAGRRTDSAATNGASVDFAAATNFGLQAYLHVMEFTGTSATIKLQESSDDGAGDAWADVVGAAFTSVTAARVAERIETARALTVERYLRVITAGVFSNLVFAVAVSKNVVSTVF